MNPAFFPCKSNLAVGVQPTLAKPVGALSGLILNGHPLASAVSILHSAGSNLLVSTRAVPGSLTVFVVHSVSPQRSPNGANLISMHATISLVSQMKTTNQCPSVTQFI